MIKNTIFIIAVFSAIFLSLESIITILGVNHAFLTFSNLLILLYCFYEFFKRKNTFRDQFSKLVFFTIIISILTILIKFLINQDAIGNILRVFTIPSIIILVLRKLQEKQKLILKRVIIILFLIECILAIIEKYLGFVFFPPLLLTENLNAGEYLYSTAEVWQFRSTSLYGQPLLNAHIVTIIVTYIVTSNIKRYKKIVLVSLGFFAILCFNARFATVIFITIILPYLFYDFISHTKQKKLVGICFISITLIVLVYLFENFGGRLVHGDITDNSAQTRLETFEFYQKIKFDELIFGRMDAMGYFWHIKNFPIENGFISAIVTYGLIMAIPLFISLFAITNRLTSTFPIKEKWVILLPFWILGLSNPNIISYHIWNIFYLCFIAFDTKHNNQ
ncbi:hypothetical protein O6P32_11955 [Phocaeicola sp. KGMB11183]|uniref:O-antigen ligase domain-containing protein n=1 Tax=Phocaeicola acetigenes TaxID=3016083 RepID=A0ABT4PK19_9BACT|nr:hypothetical protein [Phocaeicola sp. KGMB11183]MCZ8373410.1 hypothetical protein [Phocaeicola sp. KGMB11183]